jgi:diadenosine tetraphosphate (Ap4A) HIT family hydrolase
MSCVFCDMDSHLFIAANEHCFAIWDKYPVSKGHALIIAKRHCEDYFQLSQEEVLAMHRLSKEVQAMLQAGYQPDGYNLAMNCGKAAGQSIAHFHMHIIPRYAKDKPNAFRRFRESLF